MEDQRKSEVGRLIDYVAAGLSVGLMAYWYGRGFVDGKRRAAQFSKPIDDGKARFDDEPCTDCGEETEPEVATTVPIEPDANPQDGAEGPEVMGPVIPDSPELAGPVSHFARSSLGESDNGTKPEVESETQVSE